MKKKHYWLRGLTIGVIVYLLAVLYVYVISLSLEWGGAFTAMIAGMYFSPIIIVGWLVGLVWGFVKK